MSKEMKQILTGEEIATVRWSVPISDMSSDSPLVTITKEEMDNFARAIEQRILEKIGEAQAWQYPDLKTYSSETVADLKLNTQFALQLYAIPFITECSEVEAQPMENE